MVVSPWRPVGTWRLLQLLSVKKHLAEKAKGPKKGPRRPAPCDPTH